MVAFVLATCNAVARVYLGAHNPLDVVGGAAVGLAIAAVLDLVFDVARDRGVGWRGAGRLGRGGAGHLRAAKDRQRAACHHCWWIADECRCYHEGGQRE